MDEPGSLPRAVDEVLSGMSEQRAGTTVHLAEDLAQWAVGLDPSAEDLELGERALLESEPLPADRVARVVVRTPEAAVQPLIHRRPTSGLQGKFSLEYAIAATLLDGSTRAARLEAPPGAPSKPPGLEDLHAKFADCGADVPGLLAGLTWPAAAGLLRECLPAGSPARRSMPPAFRDVS